MVSIDDLYYSDSKNKASKNKAYKKPKQKIQSGDFTFFQNKAYGALIKTKQGYIGRIYRSKKDEDGRYLVYFEGSPTHSMVLSYYDFTVINCF